MTTTLESLKDISNTNQDIDIIANVTYMNPENGNHMERRIDLSHHMGRVGMSKLIIWAVRNGVELRIR